MFKIQAWLKKTKPYGVITWRTKKYKTKYFDKENKSIAIKEGKLISIYVPKINYSVAICDWEDDNNFTNGILETLKTIWEESKKEKQNGS